MCQLTCRPVNMPIDHAHWLHGQRVHSLAEWLTHMAITPESRVYTLPSPYHTKYARLTNCKTDNSILPSHHLVWLSLVV